MMLGGFREHGEHRAAAERVSDHRMHRRMRAQYFGQAVAKSRQVRQAPGRCAMRGRIDADHREARRAQRRDEAAEARRVTAPAMQQHDPRAAIAPVPHDEFVGATTQRHAFRLRDDGYVGRLDVAALRREKQAKGKAAREWHAEPLSTREKVAQPPLQRGRYTRDHASENWLAALFHDL